MSGHTAGPWAWHGVELLSATEFVLESATNGRPSPHNARLIAAAPELLAALVAINDYSRDVPAVVQEMVRAAIAKATGESA